MRHEKLANWIGETVAETLSYDTFPDKHWIRIRTSNPLERLMLEIRRRIRVVGVFPDGQSCLVLAAARLRHVTGTKGSSTRYLDMTLLAKCTLEEHGTETDELTA